MSPLLTSPGEPEVLVGRAANVPWPYTRSTSSAATIDKKSRGTSAESVRVGLRVQAVWKPKDERGWEGMSTRGWGSVAGSIDSFAATGEPDVPRERFLEHVL